MFSLRSFTFFRLVHSHFSRVRSTFFIRTISTRIVYLPSIAIRSFERNVITEVIFNTVSCIDNTKIIRRIRIILSTMWFFSLYLVGWINAWKIILFVRYQIALVKKFEIFIIFTSTIFFVLFFIIIIWYLIWEGFNKHFFVRLIKRKSNKENFVRYMYDCILCSAWVFLYLHCVLSF